MTKKMAINILRGEVLGTNEQTHEAVFMAIKALKEHAVEVVRCKDCKWYNTTEHEKCVAYDAFWVTDPDDYCAWGERREDDK